MSVAIYTRVSTKSQDTDNQVRALEEYASRSDIIITHRFTDVGISGAKGRSEREGLNDLLKAVVRKEVTRVIVWDISRLGRSLKDLLATLTEIQESGADLYIHNQGIDTSNTTGKMMFQLLGMFAEFEREIIRDRVVAGIEKAKSKGTRLGRPSVAPITKKHVIQMSEIGWSQTRIAKKLDISQAKVSLILKEYRQRPVQIDADTDQGDIFGAVRAAS